MPLLALIYKLLMWRLLSIAVQGSPYFHNSVCSCQLLASISDPPRHDKTSKMAVRPAKTQISLGIRVFAVRMKKAWVLSYPWSAQRRLWSDWADAKADLSLRWAHTHFVGFVMSWLKLTWVMAVFEIDSNIPISVEECQISNSWIAQE